MSDPGFRLYVRKARWWERIIKPKQRLVSQFKWVEVPNGAPIPDDGWFRFTIDSEPESIRDLRFYFWPDEENTDA